MLTGFELETRQQAATLYRSCWSVAQVAESMGLYYSTVLKWLKADGIYKTLSAEQLQSAIALHDANTSAKEIARSLNIPIRILCSALSASGRTPLRRLEARAKQRAALRREPSTAKRRARKPSPDTPMAEYMRIYDRQGGLCGVCREPQADKKRLLIDRTGTGEVRGLLCGICNEALDLAERKPVLLSPAMQGYLAARCGA